jgi:hypothetical protein
VTRLPHEVPKRRPQALADGFWVHGREPCGGSTLSPSPNVTVPAFLASKKSAALNCSFGRRWRLDLVIVGSEINCPRTDE